MATNGDFRRAAAYAGWRRSWDLIVSGSFTDSPFDGLCFYDSTAGVGEFYASDGRGGLSLMRSHLGWRRSWHQIIPGHFRGTARTDLLFYDRSAGHGEFYSTRPDGQIALLRRHTTWRRSWDRIVAIERATGGATSLLFYDRAAGVGQLYATDGAGNLALTRTYSTWRRTWADIIPLRIGTSSFLLFYEQGTGYAELYEMAASGALEFKAGFSGWRRNWTRILAVDLASNERSGLLFYDAARGEAAVYGIDGAGGLSRFSQTSGWGAFWSHLLSGAWGGDFGGLVRYDRSRGAAELMLLGTWPAPALEGYVSRDSVAPRQSLSIHVRSDVGAFSLQIVRRGLTDTAVANLGSFPAQSVDIPFDAAERGCNWPAATSLTIPAGFQSGLYVVQIAALETGDVYEVPFVVKQSARRKRRTRVLFAIASTTYEAYNWWGGRSLYGHGNLNGRLNWHAGAAQHVSLRRPYLSANDFEKPKFQYWELPLIRWLERNGITVDFCTSQDLHEGSALLSRYELLLCVGHDEYWSWEMRDHVEQFVAGGGNVAVLSGNSVWWQIRFDEPSTITCYKSVSADPVSANPATASRTTVNWTAPPVHRSEALLLGVSFKYASTLVYGDGVSDPPVFEVVSEHPLLEHTGLGAGSTFGRYTDPVGNRPAWRDGLFTVVGYECDARPLPPDALNWRANWQQIVAADLSVSDSPGILFYDRAAGEGEHHRVSPSGTLSLRQLHQGWRRSWDIIAAGFFGRTGNVDFLFYDRAAGHGEFYATDSQGRLSRLRQHSGWRRSWDRIVVGNFGGGSHSDLLFYDRAAGHGEFYTTDGAGGMARLRTHEGWRRSWDHIVPGRFGGDARTDLLFYDRAAGHGEFYTTDGRGQIDRLRRYETWRHTWDQIVALDFDGEASTSLLFYDRDAGHGEFYRTDGRGNMHLLRSHRTWRRTWRHIVPLKLDSGPALYLLFYEDQIGYAELYVVTRAGQMTLRRAFTEPAFTLIAKAMLQRPCPAGTPPASCPPPVEQASLGTLRIGAGLVFNASTTDWTFGLSANPNRWSAVDQITANVLHLLGSAPRVVRPVNS